MAWASGTNIATELAKGGNFTSRPEVVILPRLAGESECTKEAVSCSDIRYNGCCVPSLGKFTLAQQWTPSRSENRFTIHGLWPGDCSTGRGNDEACDSERDYQNDVLLGYIQSNTLLHDEMKAVMPTNKVNGKNIDHWKHQWRKHGTCVSDIKPSCHNIRKGQDVIRYFKMTTELYKGYNVLRAFSKDSIIPGREYSKTDIYKALHNWGDHLTLRCMNNSLIEVHFHFLGKYGQKFIPDSKHHGSDNCPERVNFQAKAGETRTQPEIPRINNQPQIPGAGNQNHASANREQKNAFLAGNQNQGQIASSSNQGQTASNQNQGQTTNNRNQGQTASNQNQGQTTNNRNQGQTTSNRNQGQTARNQNQGQIIGSQSSLTGTIPKNKGAASPSSGQKLNVTPQGTRAVSQNQLSVSNNPNQSQRSSNPTIGKKN